METQFKKIILDACIAREMKCIDGAQALGMHPKAFLRLKRRYLRDGASVLDVHKPGPKAGEAPNRTAPNIEKIVTELAHQYPDHGPQPLAEVLLNEFHITLHPTTIWRILKRQQVTPIVPSLAHDTDAHIYISDYPETSQWMDVSYSYSSDTSHVVTYHKT
jgi:transposase